MGVRRKKIEEIVRSLLNDHDIVEAPVTVAHIARTQGARIYSQELEGNLSGFLYRDDQPVIGVNTHHAKVRQNFTIAHELGHLLLHEREQLHVDHDFRVRWRDTASTQGTDEAEMEANFFAASLLMPRAFLEKDLEDVESIDLLDDDFLRQLADKYGVSSQALIYRLMYLGYIHE